MPHVHDPKKVGPGVWYIIHLACASATNQPTKMFALNLISMIAAKFACLECRKHFNEYIKRDPPEQYVDEPEGLFLWSFRAHNNANSLTGAPRMEYEEARGLYFGDGAECNKGCSSPRAQPQKMGFRMGPTW